MKKSGFTLIELIFVIVIIGLLASVAVPKFLTTKKNAETANLPEVAQQIVNKANEQYNLVQEADLNATIANDTDLQRYVTNIKSPFTYDINASQFDINYTGTDGSVNHLCLKVERKSDTVRVSKDANITAYNFIVTELNTSCNQD